MAKGTRYSASILPVLLAAGLVAWESYGWWVGEPKLRWGTPSRILEIIWEWMSTGILWAHAWSTLSVAMAGLALGGFAGVLVAYLVVASPHVGSSIVPLLTWLNALPRVLLVPLFIALLGIGLTAKLAMVIAMTLFPFFFNVLNGLLSINPRVVANARLLGASNSGVIRYVHLPLLADWLVASLRTALGFSMIGAVVSEYMGATSGLGYLVDIAYGLKRYDRALAGLVVIFVVVGILDLFVQAIERRWSHETASGRY